MIPNSKKTTKGECDRCGKLDVELWAMHHNMVMCVECREIENKAVEEAATKFNVVMESRRIDSLVELKQDVFNTATIPFVELNAAIQNDASIPANQKDYALVKECAARIDTLTAAIFADEAALLEKKNQRQAWLVNAQQISAKLHAEEREKWIKESQGRYEVNYKPQTPKKIKPTTVTVPKAKFSKKELYDAASKYKLPAPQIQSIAVAHNLTPDAAAKWLAEQMGLI